MNNLPFSKPITLSKEQRDYIEKYKKKSTQKYLKETLGENHFLDICVLFFCERLISIDESALINNNFTVGLRKENARKVERILFKLHDRLFEVKEEIGAISEKDPMLSPFKSMEESMIFLREIEGVGTHMSIIKIFKASIMRSVREIKLTDAEVIANVKHLINLKNEYYNTDSYELEFNDAVAMGMYFIFINISLILNRRELPLHGDLTFKIGYDYYESFFSAYREAIKTFNLKELNNALFDIKNVLTSFAMNYLRFVNVCSDICNDQTIRLFKGSTAFRGDRVNIHDGYDELFLKLTEGLKVRKALLPSSGIVYRAILVDTVGDVPQCLCGEIEFQINEIVTEENKIYVVIRLQREKYAMFTVYNPLTQQFKFIDIFPDKDKESTSDVISAYYGLEIYKRALEYYSEASEQDATIAHRVGVIMRGTTLFDEMSYIPQHTRRLPAGWSVSQQAIDAAKAVGLDLGENETYVRPFYRKCSKTRLVNEPSKPKDLTLTLDIESELNL